MKLLKVNDKVKNCHGLRATVENVHDDETYDLVYRNGDKNFMVNVSLIRPYTPRG